MPPKRWPNLFIIGSMKSGTSSLHEYLGSHPDIFMSHEKEPGFFIDEFTWSNGEAWYLSLFSDAKDEKYIGESSTHYTKLPRFSGAMERIKQYCPDARLIYIMRDPIERAISQYWHMTLSHNERRDMLTAIKESSHYRDISYYAMQLRPYLENFSEQQLYILTFEQLISQPSQTMRDLFSWLSVDTSHVPPNLTESFNATPKAFEQERKFSLLNNFRYSSFWEKVSPFVPKGIRTVGSNMAVKKIDRTQQDVEAVRDYLRPAMLKQTEELEQLLGRQFNEWKTLHSK